MVDTKLFDNLTVDDFSNPELVEQLKEGINSLIRISTASVIKKVEADRENVRLTEELEETKAQLRDAQEAIRAYHKKTELDFETLLPNDVRPSIRAALK